MSFDCFPIIPVQGQACPRGHSLGPSALSPGAQWDAVVAPGPLGAKWGLYELLVAIWGHLATILGVIGASWGHWGWGSMGHLG